MANIPTRSIVKLKSPFNGDIITREFIKGRMVTGETLEAIIQAGYVLIDEETQPKAKRKDAEE